MCKDEPSQERSVPASQTTPEMSEGPSTSRQGETAAGTTAMIRNTRRTPQETRAAKFRKEFAGAQSFVRHGDTTTLQSPDLSILATACGSEVKSKSEESGPTIFIADASRMGCQLMAAALQISPYRFTVVHYALDSAGIRTGLGENAAEIAIICAHLKDGAIAGFDAVREIRVSHPTTGVIMMLDSIEAAMVVEAFRAGARGILSREQPFEVLCNCIHAVHQGQVWASSEEMHFALDALARTPSDFTISAKGPRRPNLLTKREAGVVNLVAEGLTNRDISLHLNLSENTVRNYLFRIFNKVGTSNRLELALYAINRREESSRIE
jgi:two-component system nitrate/nitrite response regulator NarL